MRLIKNDGGGYSLLEISDLDLAQLQVGLVLGGFQTLSSEPQKLVSRGIGRTVGTGGVTTAVCKRHGRVTCTGDGDSFTGFAGGAAPGRCCRAAVPTWTRATMPAPRTDRSAWSPSPDGACAGTASRSHHSATGGSCTLTAGR